MRPTYASIIAAMLLALFLATAAAVAEEVPLSPERLPKENWEDAMRREAKRSGVDIYAAESALSQSMDMETIERMEEDGVNVSMIGGIPAWTSGFSALSGLFSSAKWRRWYANPNSSRFRRLAAWKYPNDGCYTKAAHVSAVAASNGYLKPGKVFAFGNLSFASPYARSGRGRVFWWYHMAAAYHIGSTIWVVDPSTASGLITLSTWLRRISSNPSAVRVSYCDYRAYSAASACIGSGGNGSYLGHMPRFLSLEWNNLISLGYSPSALLGP